MGNVGLTSSTGDKQTFVSAHSDLDAKRAGDELELSESFAHGGDAAR